MDTVLMDMLRSAVPTIAVILVLKFLFVSLIQVPGLTPLLASI